MEHAFKHGVETLRKNAFVDMTLKTTDKEIVFEIKNNFDTENLANKGIGLENLERRLSIMYPNNYNLTTKSDDNIFTALLTITNS